MTSTTAKAGSTAKGQSDSISIRVYNTLTREKEPFRTVTPGKVGIYLCGPTVYKEAHIGHMVGPVIFDCIKRYLSYSGFDVTWVVNITDVDDKLIAESNRRQVPMAQIAEEMIADYMSNLQALGVDQIDATPRATDHMQQIIEFISGLIEKGFAYESGGDVYFEVAKDREYGKLSNRSAETQQGEGGEMASRKRAAGDFALWKGSKPGEPSWDSPWGEGRPGWHIECSAMSQSLLGESFDIHGGGLDLMFPHHENEIAQSECCHGVPMARYWMHNGLMRASSDSGKVGGRGEREPATLDTKISRSKGAGGLADLIQIHSGERIRFFLLRTHYRSTIVFGEEGLAEAGAALETFHRFFERFRRITGRSFYELPAPTRRDSATATTTDHPLLQQGAKYRAGFLSKMDDDFNTGAAVGELFEWVRALNKFIDEQQLEDSDARRASDLESLVSAVTILRELTSILGLFSKAPAAATGQGDKLVDQLMQVLIEIRATARAHKDFATADRVRDELQKVGIQLEDRKGETGWRQER